ncbi:MAG: IS1634 family transposase [Planctomycetes bacterium]|nr:IS1634 family transposase [Planctomycetota bacterium]
MVERFSCFVGLDLFNENTYNYNVAYNYEQAVGKHVYVYRIESHWDKEKKQSRQKRIYLGKKDPVTGTVNKAPRAYTSKEFGTIFLLDTLIHRSGLDALLQDHFPDVFQELLFLACFQTAEHKALYLCESWLEGIYHTKDVRLHSTAISRLLKGIGEDEQAVHMFLKEWTQKTPTDRFMVFDITSISSYAKNIDFVEWGYNRDRERLPQINLGVVYGEPSDRPLFYSVYPGSVPDVKTLKNILVQLEVFEVATTLFVMDRGFYSVANIANMGSQVGFIIPLPVSNNIAKELIEQYEFTLSDPKNAMRFNKQVLFSVTDRVFIAKQEYTAHLFLDESRRSTGRETFLRKLLDVEILCAEKSFRSKQKLVSALEDELPGWKQYLTVVKSGTGYALQRKEDAIGARLSKLGILILITNVEMPADEALDFYRRKDCVEKYFDSLKNDLEKNRLRIHSQEALKGKLFVDFLSLILHTMVQHALKETKLQKRYSVQEMFYELRKLRRITIGEKKTVLTEMTKKQRTILEAFDISLDA